MKSPDFQTERVVRMEENIVGFDVEVADSRLVQILQGFSKLATIRNRKYTIHNTHVCIGDETGRSFRKLESCEKITCAMMIRHLASVSS